MAKINSIGNSTGSLSIDPGAAGDSFVQFSINATPEFIIGCDDTDDSFRIANGSALGTTDYFVMSAAGERTMPLQPCFCAEGSTTGAVTGDGTVATATFSTAEYFDQNGDFDGTSTFTSPVTAKYLFNSDVSIGSITTSFTFAEISLVTTARTYSVGVVQPGKVFSATQYAASLRISVIANMTAADTAYITVKVSGGTKSVDVQGAWSFFNGCLLC